MRPFLQIHYFLFMFVNRLIGVYDLGHLLYIY